MKRGSFLYKGEFKSNLSKAKAVKPNAWIQLHSEMPKHLNITITTNITKSHRRMKVIATGLLPAVHSTHLFRLLVWLIDEHLEKSEKGKLG